jgi:hypothetical protein
MTQLPLLKDQALGEGTDETLDGLGFVTYARVLADAAAFTPGPFTIGIFGEWGTGKTSLMRLIESNLKGREGIITVWFNAWRYEQEEHPIVPLVGTIVRALQQRKDFLNHLKDGGQSLLKALRAIAYGFSSKSKVKIPGFAEIEASFVARDMIDRVDRLTPDPLLDRSLYYEAFEALEAVKNSGNCRIVVIVDDLDRCFPDLAIRLLESIKLVLSQPEFIFVLGVARSVIEGYLQHRYQTDYGILGFQGSSYLDKIVQLPFHIPPHSGRMEQFSTRLLERLEPSTRATLSDILPIIASAAGSNPRSTIRFINNLLIDIGISSQLVELEIMTAIPVGYFAVSRCLQQRWPDTFSTLSRSNDVCQAVVKWGRSRVDIRQGTASGSEEQASLATKLLTDQDLFDLLNSDQGGLWLSNQSIRNAAIQFLRSQRQETEAESRDAMKEYDIFISYPAENRIVVSEIAEFLSANKARIFMDTLIRPGDNWVQALNTALRSSRAVGVCIGPKTAESTGMTKEIVLAVKEQQENKSVRIIPIILPGADWSMAPDTLRNYQGVDLSKGINKDALRKLLEGLAL